MTALNHSYRSVTPFRFGCSPCWCISLFHYTCLFMLIIGFATFFSDPCSSSPQSVSQSVSQSVLRALFTVRTTGGTSSTSTKQLEFLKPFLTFLVMALALLLHLLTAFITFDTHVRQLLTAFIAFETHVHHVSIVTEVIAFFFLAIKRSASAILARSNSKA